MLYPKSFIICKKFQRQSSYISTMRMYWQNGKKKYVKERRKKGRKEGKKEKRKEKKDKKWKETKTALCTSLSPSRTEK